MHDEEELSFTVKERQENAILKMVNFRTYAAATIQIPRACTTLINGISGAGKTTIMEFFLYVLYDGVAQPEKHDTKRCWGWLIFDNIVVYRQKDPKLLKVWINDLESFTKMGPDTPVKAVSGKEYTADEAQAVINHRFGTMNVFLATSYLRQKEFSVLLTGTDAEKLEIIKEITTKHGEFDGIKNPIKKALTVYENRSIASQAQFSQTVNSMQNFDRVNPNLVQQSDQIPEDPTVTMEKVRSLRAQQEDLRSVYTQAVERETKTKMMDNEIDKIALTLNNWTQRLQVFKDRDLEKELDQLRLDISSSQDNSEADQKKILLSIRKRWEEEKGHKEKQFDSCKKELSTLLEFLSKALEDKSIVITDLNKSEEWLKKAEKKLSLWDQYRRDQHHYNEMLPSIKGGIPAWIKFIESQEEELKKQQKLVDEIRETIEEHRKNQWWDCPKCSTSLVMSADRKSLQIKEGSEAKAAEPVKAPASAPTAPTPATTPSIQTGSLFAKKISTTPPPSPPTSNPTTSAPAKKESPTHVPCKYSYEDLMKAAAKQSELANAINGYKDSLKQVQGLEKSVKERQNELGSETIQYLHNLAGYTSRLPSSIQAYQTSRQSFERHINDEPQKIDEEEIKQNSGSRLDSLRDKEKVLVKEIEVKSMATLMIEENSKQLEELKNQRKEIIVEDGKSSQDIILENSKLQGQIDHLLHLNNSSDLLAQRTLLQKTMNEKAEEAKLAQAKYQACKRLLQKAQEAERVALESAVCEINTLLAMILKQLFTNTPISVEIRTTKELKSKKGQVSQRFDIPIFYGQSSYKSYKQLSGGEKDRLSLAITMALSEKFGGSMLFLDETLHSLDPEVKGNAIATLKEFSSKGRMVLVAAHEETEGFYDRVIPLRTRA